MPFQWRVYGIICFILFFIFNQIFLLYENRKLKRKTINVTSDGIRYRARWETGDSIAVASIQDRFYPSFFIPPLFLCEYFISPVTISTTQFLSSANKQQLRNRETAIPAMLH